jgi:dihydroflavonol-4-reductase
VILVTGASGFLGRHLVEQLLAEGLSVRGLRRRVPVGLETLSPAAGEGTLDWAVGDVRDAESVRNAMRGVKKVFHVAGKIDFDGKHLAEMRAVNVDGTRIVMAAAAEAGVEKVVHVSSVSTIGAVASPDRTLNEDSFGKGLGVDLPYPASKLDGEKVALEYAAKGLPVLVCNPTYMGGPGDVNLGSVHTAASFVRGQVWVGLTTGGFGYTDIRDAARGLRLAMEKGTPGRRYIIGGTNILLREYHDLLSKLTGRRPPRIRLAPWLAEPLAFVGRIYYRALGMKPYVTRGDVRMGRHYWLFDYSRAKNELGLTVRTLEESLRDCLVWLGEQRIVPMEKVKHLQAQRN